MGTILTAACLARGDARAATYSFTKIADDNTGLASATLDMNGMGKAAVSGNMVAFHACYGDGTGCGIFTGTGGALTTIVKDGTAAPMGTFSSDFTLPPPFGPDSFAGRPAISGTTVTFKAGYQFDSCSGNFSNFGIFTGNGGPVTTIARRRATRHLIGAFSSFLDPAISGMNVAFQGGYGANLKGIFSSSRRANNDDRQIGRHRAAGGGPHRLSSRRRSVEAQWRSKPTIVAGKEFLLAAGVRRRSSPRPAIAAPIGTFDANGFFEPAISGTNVAFRARYGSEGGTGIFRGNGRPLTTIAKMGDPARRERSFAISTRRSAGNNVAFVGNYAASNTPCLSAAVEH